MAASQVVSIRLNGNQVERLRKVARRMGKSQSQMGAQMIEESLRESEFGMIEFRETGIGRKAFLRGTRLKISGMITVGRGYDHDRAAIARHFDIPVLHIEAAYRYYEAFREEIDQEIEDNYVGYERLKQLFPDMTLTEIKLD